MNDYLWDRTGEPDEEVRRLEELLGTLRHRPEALPLPTVAPVPARHASRPFRWPYAAAAALALAALAGLWFGLPRRSDTTAKSNQGAPLDARTETAAAAPDTPREDGREVSDGRGRETQLANVTRGRTVKRHQARAAKRDAQHLNARTLASHRRKETPAAVAPTSEQQAAKEQLMFALRLASAKLGDAKRKTSPSTPAPTSRPPRDELNKLR
jgi:hypothetical protein